MTLYRQLKARGELLKAFKAAELYRTRKKANQISYQYPHIQDVKVTKGYTRYVFTLLNGMNPSKIYENDWALKQVLGKTIEIKGDLKQFVVTVHRKGLPSYVPYCYNEFVSEIQGMELPIICGKDAYNQYVSYDMAKFETLLLTGEIGAGKSSLLRAIITTLIQYRKPDELRFVLVDLKRADLGIFEHVSHVEGVYVSAKEMHHPFKKLKVEMSKRGDLLRQHEVSHIEHLPDKIPRLVVVIDEMSIIRKEKELISLTEDIASQGRALGIHLILAMQRADSKMLESGSLKNNMRVRISGRQSDSINAKVAGVPGAEEIGIAERGRMKMKLDEVMEFQSVFLSEEEAKKIIRPYKVNSVLAESAVIPPSNLSQPLPFGILEEEETHERT